MKKNLYVISVGGSLIAGDRIDVGFLRRFYRTIHPFFPVAQFICCAGGGGVGRAYQSALRSLGADDSKSLDLIGISSTLLNAYLLKAAIRGSVYPKIIQQPSQLPKRFRESVLVASGWNPGQSSDGVAVDIALALRAKLVINLTNVDGVFPIAPNKRHSGQTPIKKLTWTDYFQIVGRASSSGEHQPFGVVGAQKAQTYDIDVLVMSGRSMTPLRRFLVNGEMNGTLIKG